MNKIAPNGGFFGVHCTLLENLFSLRSLFLIFRVVLALIVPFTGVNSFIVSHEGAVFKKGPGERHGAGRRVHDAFQPGQNLEESRVGFC